MTGVERAIAEVVAAGRLDPQIPASDVRDLVISHIRSLEGIEVYEGLRTLSLIGCSIGDYSALSRLTALRVLIIENSDLDDVRWAAALKLRVVVLRWDRLRDALTVVGLPTLQSLDLTGNPLNDETRVAAKALAPHRLVTIDDEETAGLNRSLADTGTGIVAYREGTKLWACATGLELTGTPEAGHVSVTADELLAVARATMSPSRLLHLDSGGDDGEGGGPQ